MHFNYISDELFSSPIFLKTLSSEELELMNLPLQSIKFEHIEAANKRSEGITHTLKHCLCILLSHSQCADEELVSKLLEIGISETTLIQGLLTVQKYAPLENFSHEQIKKAIKKNYFEVFQLLAALGDLTGIKKLCTYIPEEKQEMIKATGYSFMQAGGAMCGSLHNYGAFRQAAKNGKLNILNWLKQEAPHIFQEMLAEKTFFAFVYAADFGQLEVMQWMAEQVNPERLATLFSAPTFCGSAKNGAVRLALEHGNLPILKWLAQQMPELVKETLENLSYMTIQENFTEVLKWLQLTMTKLQFQSFLALNEYSIFTQTAKHGHLDLLKWLISFLPTEHIPRMREGNKYSPYPAFRLATDEGHLPVLNLFRKQVSNDEFIKMLTADYYYVFNTAASCGHLRIMNWVLKYLPEDQIQPMLNKAFINENVQLGFCGAAANGRIDVLDVYLNHPTLKACIVNTPSFFEGFRYACFNGKIEVLRWYKLAFPEHLLSLIQYKDHSAFGWGATHYDPSVLEWFAVEFPESMDLMIENGFILAAINGQLKNLQWFEKNYPEKINQFIQVLFNSKPNNEFALASPGITRYLFSHQPEYFEWVKSDNSFYWDYCIKTFIKNTVFLLQSRTEEFENSHPNQYFDVDQKEGLLLFSILHLLIEQKKLQFNAIQLLLKLPSVQAHVHKKQADLLDLAKNKQHDSLIPLLEMSSSLDKNGIFAKKPSQSDSGNLLSPPTP